MSDQDPKIWTLHNTVQSTDPHAVYEAYRWERRENEKLEAENRRLREALGEADPTMQTAAEMEAHLRPRLAALEAEKDRLDAENERLWDLVKSQAARIDALERGLDLREADLRRLRALTEGDPRTIYHEAAGYRKALAEIVARPMPDGNASCATELERVKALARKALEAGDE